MASGTTSSGTTKRRAVFEDPAQQVYRQYGVIDLEGVPNADSRAPMMIAIQELCSHGAWHTVDRVALPFWEGK